jgi:hypothetical protein
MKPLLALLPGLLCDAALWAHRHRGPPAPAAGHHVTQELSADAEQQLDGGDS